MLFSHSVTQFHCSFNSGVLFERQTGLTLYEGQILLQDFSLILIQHWFTCVSLICKAHLVQQTLCNKCYLCLRHQSQDTGVVCLMSLKSVKLNFSANAHSTHMSE